MEAPPAYLEQLPKHAKSLALADSLRKALTKQVNKLDVFSVLLESGVQRGDKLALLETWAPAITSEPPSHPHLV